MRGLDDRSEGLFSYIRLEEWIPADHPLRGIKALADAALVALDRRFDALYSSLGRPSIPPEMLLRATMLQAFFSVRSERMLMEQINYNLLFRWFVGLPIDAEVWHPTVFTHNRDRVLETEVAREFLAALLALPQVKKLLSNEHFSVDGTLIDAWASMKSFRPKDGSGEPPAAGRNGERNFRKETTSSEPQNCWRKQHEPLDQAFPSPSVPNHNIEPVRKSNQTGLPNGDFFSSLLEHCMATTVEPQLGAPSFSCPHCGALAHQGWFQVFL